jgi:hypothetical protein
MSGLPKQFYKYFWDSDPTTIDMERHPQYVIERVLEWGRSDDLRELISLFGREKLIEVLMHSKQLSLRNANFLATIWDIPKERVLCLQPEFRRTHRQSWNR